MIRLSTIATVAVIALLSTVACSRPAIEKTVTGKDAQDGVGQAEINASRLAYISGRGLGQITATFTSRNQPSPQEVNCTFYGSGNDVCLLWSIDDLHYDSKDTVKLKVAYKRLNFDEQGVFDFKVFAGDFVEVSATERYRVILNGAESVNMLTDFKSVNISKFHEASTKVQFVTLLPYGNQMDTTHALDMYIKKGTTRASSKNSIVQDSSKIGFGLVKTLVPSDPDYCLDVDCKVAIHYDVVNVVSFDFFMIIKDKDTEINLYDGNTFMEDLTADDQITYVIDNTYQPDALSWKFVLMPISGDPDMAVNLNSKPKKIQDYNWKTSADRPEEILITKQELKDIKGEKSKIYLTFSSSLPTQFIFKIMTSVDESATNLRPNLPVMGEADAGEIVKYVYSTHANHPESISVFAKLTAQSGDPDLYIKDCPSLKTNEECAITQSDINNWSALEKDESRLALKSTQKRGDDSLYLRFNCMPSNEKFDNFKFEGDEASLFTTKRCIFAVAVYGKTSAVQTKSKYVLELKGSKHHSLLELKKPSFISQGPKTNLYYKLTIDKVDPKHKYLNFRFMVNSGDFDVFTSRNIPFPDEANADSNEHISTKVGQSVAQYEHFVTVEGDSDSLKGDHYLSIVPSTYTLANVVAYTSINNAEAYSGEKYQEITFNNGIFDTIKVSENAAKSYYFSLDVPEELSKDTEVTLELVAIKGKFSYCVSSNVTKIDKDIDCIWSDYNYDGNIIFNSRDKDFKRQFDYGVLVKPIYQKSMEGEVYSFSLLLTSQDQYTLLSPGVPYRTGKVTSSHSYFQIGVNRDTDFLTLMLSSQDAQVQMEVSNDAEDFLSSAPSKFHRIATGKNAAVLYKKSEMKSVCDVYKKYYQAEANMVKSFKPSAMSM